MSLGLPIQDWVLLGGEITPGLATITGAGMPRKWDKAQGFGLSGAFLRYMGDDLKDFEISLYLWTEAQVEDFYEFARKVLSKPPKGKRPKAIEIKHPLLDAPPLLIRSVVVSDVSQLEEDELGGWNVTISLIPFRAPILAIGRVAATFAKATNAAPTAQDAKEREIQQKRAEFARLAGGG